MMTTKISGRLPTSPQQPNFGKRLTLKFIAGTPALVLLPSMMLTACGGGSTNASSSSQYVSNAEEAAAIALAMASLASSDGTYGVGGVIIENSTGKVIKAMQNRVVQPLGSNIGAMSNRAYTNDPTAHGEVQLVTWYYANAQELNLPTPDKLTIVSSLDPCAMCAGTLITSGFNVAVVAYDEVAGINWNTDFNFLNMPSIVQTKLLNQFGYYAIEGMSPSRQYVGASHVAFSNTAVSYATGHGCLTVFTDSSDAVRNSIAGNGLDPRNPSGQTPMEDPASNTAIKNAYQAIWPDAFSIKLINYRAPTPALKTYLLSLVAQNPSSRNAVAFIDFYGNLLMASADRFDISPIQTAMMTVIQNYSRLLFQLINSADTSSLAQQTLTNPKYGTFVYLYAPSAEDTTTLKDMGAFGSSMAGNIPVIDPSNLQFYEDPLNNISGLRSLIAAMPPIYRLGYEINPQPVNQPV
jgi:tRNA(Arg) A34 adenosine deaminase TadA